MNSKKYTFCSLFIAILLTIVLSSCNRYGCPAANNPVDYAAIINPMEAEAKKKDGKVVNQYTGRIQNGNGKAQSQRKTRKQQKKRKKTPNKKKKVNRKNL